MKIQLPDISQQDTLENTRRFTSVALQILSNAINGQLSFLDNVNCQFLGATFTAANTQIQIAHTLNRVPSGYLVTKRSTATTIYDGTSTWTATNIYLKASAIGNATLLLF